MQDILKQLLTGKDNQTYDWNVICYGYLTLDRDTSTATINKVK